MINPNGDEFKQGKPLGETPLGESMSSSAEQISSEADSRMRQTARRVSSAAGETWQQTKEKAGVARERTEFFLRENPVPTIIGALTLGLAIGLAIRYATSDDKKEVEVKSPLGDVNWSMLSLPFLWPFFKSVRQKIEDSAETVKDTVKDVDVNRYVKPLRKKWRAWTN